MKTASAFSFGVVVTTVILLAAAGYHRHHPAAAAELRADPTVPAAPNYPGVHQAILEQEKRDPPGILFLGDSITDLWRTVPWEWESKFKKFHPCNAGISSDQIQHVLWRVGNGELDGIRPRVIVLEIGTNNLGLGHDDPDQTFRGICNLIRFIRTRSNAQVLVIGLFPRQDQFAPLVPRVNEKLAELARTSEEKGIFFLDAGATIPKQDFPDGLHPNPEGYRKWAEVMLPTLERLYIMSECRESSGERVGRGDD